MVQKTLIAAEEVEDEVEGKTFSPAL